MVLKLSPQDAVFDDAIFDTALDDGLDQEAVSEPEVQVAPPKEVMAARNTRSMSQACKVINTKLHWLRLLLP